MIWTELRERMASALAAAGLLTSERLARLELAVPRESSHGDWTTNLAMVIAKDAKRPPRPLAEELAKSFPVGGSIGAVEVAGPGFLNFRYSDAFVASLPAQILAAGAAFGRCEHGAGERVLVEYVSANPTGPMNVVSARAAAVGSTLVRLLQAAGYDAAGEFYVNDAGNQVDLLGASVAARFAQRFGIAREVPEGGYQGRYLHELAAQLPEAQGRAALAAPDGAQWFRDAVLARMVAWQQQDLADYGVTFERWFLESALHQGGAVDATLATLTGRGMTYRSRGPLGVSEAAQSRVSAEAGAAAGAGEATWLKTFEYGDDMDRVVVRADGRPTYLLPDIAYHRDKRARGFRRAINLWGPDHHAYVATLSAALQACGLEPDFLQVLIVQQVNLLRDGVEVKMSKRAGEFVTLRDLIDEVGADCAKFFFLMRATNSHLDFDMTLARAQKDENPAFYVQYAHARVASVLAKGAEAGVAPETGDPPAFSHAAEVALVRKLSTFPEVVRGAAVNCEPHRIPAYLIETAAEFHRFYHACQIVGDDLVLSRHRLRLCAATQRVLRNGLSLMGVSAPDRLERAAEITA